MLIIRQRLTLRDHSVFKKRQVIIKSPSVIIIWQEHCACRTSRKWKGDCSLVLPFCHNSLMALT